MFRFGNPEYLYFLIILPILFLGFIYLNRKKKKDVEKLGNLKLIKSLMPELSLKRSYLKFWLIFSAVVFGIITLARPQFGIKTEKVDKKGIELVIAIDISNSMLAKDVKPNRLTRAKQIMTRIIDERKGDKVALVVFAGDAFVQMPMTADSQSAKIFLENIDPSIIPVQGTAIGSALTTAINCFSSDKEIDKSIVLITDGENHEGDGAGIAQQAVAAGIQVNVVGIGSLEGSPIPVSEYSEKFKQDSQGNIVISKFNEQMCEEIAKAGKGRYVHADNTNNALKGLQEELNKLQTKSIDGVAYSEYDEKFHLFAWCMLILLAIEVCVFDKKNRLFRNVRLFK